MWNTPQLRTLFQCELHENRAGMCLWDLSRYFLAFPGIPPTISRLGVGLLAPCGWPVIEWNSIDFDQEKIWLLWSTTIPLTSQIVSRSTLTGQIISWSIKVNIVANFRDMDTRWLLFVFAFAQVVLLQPPSVPDLYIVTLPSGNPITVYLFGSDPHNETLQVQIESLPLHGELFQTFDGFTKQDKIKQYDYVVDPLRFVSSRIVPGLTDKAAACCISQIIKTSSRICFNFGYKTPRYHHASPQWR